MPGKDRWRNIAADEFGFTVQAPKTNDELSAYGLEPTHKVKTGVVDEGSYNIIAFLFVQSMR